MVVVTEEFAGYYRPSPAPAAPTPVATSFDPQPPVAFDPGYGQATTTYQPSPPAQPFYDPFTPISQPSFAPPPPYYYEDTYQPAPSANYADHNPYAQSYYPDLELITPGQATIDQASASGMYQPVVYEDQSLGYERVTADPMDAYYMPDLAPYDANRNAIGLPGMENFEPWQGPSQSQNRIPFDEWLIRNNAWTVMNAQEEQRAINESGYVIREFPDAPTTGPFARIPFHYDVIDPAMENAQASFAADLSMQPFGEWPEQEWELYNALKTQPDRGWRPTQDPMEAYYMPEPPTGSSPLGGEMPGPSIQSWQTGLEQEAFINERQRVSALEDVFAQPDGMALYLALRDPTFQRGRDLVPNQTFIQDTYAALDPMTRQRFADPQSLAMEQNTSWKPLVDIATQSLLPEAATNWLPNPAWAPVEDVVEGGTSILGLSTLPLSFIGAGGTGLVGVLRTIGVELAQEYGSALAPRLAAEYGPEWAENPAVQLALGLIGGAGAGISAAAAVRAGVPESVVREAAQIVEDVPQVRAAVTDSVTPAPLRVEPEGVSPPSSRQLSAELLPTERAAVDEYGSLLGGFKPLLDRVTGTIDSPDELRRLALPGEKPDMTAFRRHEGQVNAEMLRVTDELLEGNNLLKDLKVGHGIGPARVVNDSPEVRELYKVLHGEADPSALTREMRAIYDDIKPRLDAETARSVDFDPGFVPLDDYFYRGWKEPKAGPGPAALGARAGFMQHRSAKTFSEMLDSGREPLSWNPYDMLALRNAAGVRWREQQALIAVLKEAGIAIDASGAVPSGYRVPRVGPAFEGKPLPFTTDEGSAALSFSPKLAVPNQLADLLEDMYGAPLNIPKVGKVAIALGQASKRLALFGSVFQQIDFATRTGGADMAGAIDALLSGKPHKTVVRLAKMPVDVAQLVRANLSPNMRTNIRKQILSGESIVPGRNISFKSIAQAGGLQADRTILRQDVMSALEKALGPRAGWPSRVRLRVANIEKAMQRGLFEGVYPQAQMTAIRNFIAPRIARQHPNWTDAQISAAIASETNKMFSSLPTWQQMMKNREMKEIARTLIFSTNEPESLIRGAFSAIPGMSVDSGLWREYWVGAFLALALAANAIHYAVTGEFLPTDRYTPVKKDGNGPFGWAYNSKFVAPDLPFKGRNNQPLTLDLAGQMDTVFRLLDPKSFVESRWNRLPRAVLNQWRGKDFYGEPYKDPLDRFWAALQDLGAPIGAGNLIGVVSGDGPEGRIGKWGQLLQSGGLNVRGETTADMKDRVAQEKYGKKWDDLSPREKLTIEQSNDPFAREMLARQEEAIAQGKDWAIDQKRADEAKAKYTKEQQASDAAFEKGTKTGEEWREERRIRKAAQAAEMRGIYGEYTEKPREEWTPLDRLFEQIDLAKGEDGEVDWDVVEAWQSRLSPEEQRYIEENTGLTLTATERKYKDDLKYLDRAGFYDVEEGRLAWVRENPEVVERLEKWGLSESTTQAYRAEEEFQDQQAESDRKLASGELSMEQWREQLRDREIALRERKNGIYAGFADDPDSKSESLLDGYYDQVEAATYGDGTVNWDAVETWTAQQPPEVQKAIEERERFYLSEEVREFKEAQKGLGDAGFFDLYDVAWQQFTAENPSFAQYESYDAYKTAWVQSQPDRRKAEVEFDSSNVAKRMSQLKNGAIENEWLAAHPQEAYDAYYYGYWTPAKENGQKEWLDYLIANGLVQTR